MHSDRVCVEEFASTSDSWRADYSKPLGKNGLFQSFLDAYAVACQIHVFRNCKTDRFLIVATNQRRDRERSAALAAGGYS